MKNNNFNLLKIMFKTSYDTSNIINHDTGKLNKKSPKVWILGIASVMTIYLSYMIINLLKDTGYTSAFVELFFLILQLLIIVQSISLSISVMYFSDDIENYLTFPISNFKLLFSKFATLLMIIFGTELLITVPSLLIYGVMTMADIWYFLLLVLVLLLITIFLNSIIQVLAIFIMRICRFIKNKNVYKNVILIIMTFIILLPIEYRLQSSFGEVLDNTYSESEEQTENLESLNSSLSSINNIFIIGEIGVKALTDTSSQRAIYVLELIGLTIIAVSIFFIIGRFTYIKDVITNLSMFDKKKKKKINLKKACRVRNKKWAYLRSEIRNVIKNQTYFMHYVYNIIIVLLIISMLTIFIIPEIIAEINVLLEENEITELELDFSVFSFIIGFIQVLFIMSSLSLTAISRYGKSAIFFKYIPIKYKTQFNLKSVPNIIMNTIIIVVILGVIYYLIPGIGLTNILALFIVSMLLNFINSYVLLIIDLIRPQLNYENEISVIKQNNNKIVQYIFIVGICVILWYISEVNNGFDSNLNTAIISEIIAFSLIIVIMKIIIHKKQNKLFKKIQ